MPNSNRLARVARSLAQDFGQAVLRGVLGRTPASRSGPPSSKHTRGSGSRVVSSPHGAPRGAAAPHIEYAPRADGRADPGEIVWAWVPYEEDASRGKDRPVLVIAREGEHLLALPTTSKDHDRDAAQEAAAGRHWMDIGSGAWDAQRRPSEVRLDRMVRIDATTVRREGAALDRATFQRVVTAMRATPPPRAP